MLSTTLRQLRAFGRRFAGETQGSIAIYAAAALVLGVGAGAIAIDIGRMGVLTSQLQNRADAGAMAGARQLDGQSGAQARAQTVAMNVMVQTSGLAADQTALSVQSVNFYKSYNPPVAATGDADSKFIEVVLANRTINFFFEPALKGVAGTSEILKASAMATISPFICHAPPLMICDLGEDDASVNLNDSSIIGRQVLVKPAPSGGTAWAAGNYGLLALPDGSSGANDLETALAAVTPADCYTLDVTTAPGVKTNKIKNGLNARFDLPGGLSYPAPNVIAYPRDSVLVSNVDARIGGGDWDLAAYWSAKHAGGLPAELANATRYQMYLYELGLSYAHNGKATIYPPAAPLPAGYTVISPAAPSVPVNAAHATDPQYDGVPSQAVASNGQARRLAQVAVLECKADGVKGKHSYPTHGRYLEMFITEPVTDAPDGGIYAEIVRTLSPGDTPDYHANVKLVK